MSQRSVKQFFQARKRSETDPTVHASKRAKLTADTPGPLGHLPALTTTSIDDHDLPPSLTVESTDSVASRKRSRPPSKESEGFKTTGKGYDFSAFAGDGNVLEGRPGRKVFKKSQNVTEPEKPENGDDVVTERPMGKITVSSVDAMTDDSVKKKLEEKTDDPEAMKKKLATCSNLVELKEMLSRIGQNQSKQNKKLMVKVNSSELKEKLKQYGENKARLQQLKTSEKACLDQKAASPQEEMSDDRPQGKAAHERFHSLVEPSVVPTLSLPASYSMLLEMFRCSDNVVSWLDNRSEICTFDKLKKAVEQALRKGFELRHLGQFKTVYPTAYHFRQEKDLPCVGGKVSGYQLTVEANLDDSSVDIQSVNSTKTSLKEKILFTAAKLVERRGRFHQSLINIVQRFHEEFLKKLNIKLKVAVEKLTRWHPKFVLEEVPEIQPSPLPEKPGEKKITTASEALQLHRDKFDLRVQRALEIVAKRKLTGGTSLPSSDNTSSCGSNSLSSAAPSGTRNERASRAVKGIPQSLLERVRAKEAHIAESYMMRTPEEQHRLERLKRLPELIRILRTYFVGQKRPAVPVTDAIQAFTNSYQSFLGPVEADCHLRLIAEVVPHWMQLVRITKGEYVKLDDKMELSVVIREVEKAIANMQSKATVT